MYKGRVLEDSELVDELFYCTIWLDVRSSTTMTVGAGGTIRQDIAEDTNNPRIWDLGSSKLLSIQIVNAAVFEKITGMLAPPTPISAQTYAAQKLPFYQLYNETPSTVGGAFSEVESIPDNSAHQTCAKCHSSPAFKYVLPFLYFCTRKFSQLLRFRPCNHYFCSRCAAPMQTLLKCEICCTSIERSLTISTSASKSMQGPIILLKMSAGRPVFKSIVEDVQDDEEL